MYKIFISFFILILSFNLFAYEYQQDKLTMKLGDKKCFSVKKILEIKNLNHHIVNIRKDNFMNKMCIISVSLGKTRVYLFQKFQEKTRKMNYKLVLSINFLLSIKS